MPEPSLPYLDLRGKTVEQLLALKLELEASMSVIRTRICKVQVVARNTGAYSEESWWIKAHQALHIKGKQCQQIQNELGRLRRERAKGLDHRFVDLARERLPAELFQAILKDAKG